MHLGFLSLLFLDASMLLIFNEERTITVTDMTPSAPASSCRQDIIIYDVVMASQADKFNFFLLPFLSDIFLT